MIPQCFYAFACLAVVMTLSTACAKRPDPHEGTPPTARKQTFRVLEGHSQVVIDGVFSPDGRQALTAGGDWTVRLWDVATGEEIRKYGEDISDYRKGLFHEGQRTVCGSVRKVAFCPEFASVLAAYDCGIVRMWEKDTGNEVWRFEGFELGVMQMRLSSDGTKVLAASRDGSAKLLDTASGRELLSLDGHKESVCRTYVWDAVFSPDGRRILTAGNDKTARLWDVETGQEFRRFDHEDEVRECAFLPGGTHVLTSNGGSAARLWDVESGAEVTDRACLSAFGALSPDGNHVLGTQPERDEDGYRWIATLWDIDTDRNVSEFVFRDNHCPVATFSGNGNQILTFDGSRYAEDYSLRLWDVDSGKEICTLKGHQWHVSGAVFSPDGKHLLSWENSSGVAIIWDVPE